MHEARDLQDELFKIGVDACMVEAAAGSALKPISKNKIRGVHVVHTYVCTY